MKLEINFRLIKDVTKGEIIEQLESGEELDLVVRNTNIYEIPAEYGVAKIANNPHVYPKTLDFLVDKINDSGLKYNELCSKQLAIIKSSKVSSKTLDKIPLLFGCLIRDEIVEALLESKKLSKESIIKLLDSPIFFTEKMLELAVNHKNADDEVKKKCLQEAIDKGFGRIVIILVQKGYLQYLSCNLDKKSKE